MDCIVQLPDKLFFGTGIPGCLWFLSKNRGGPRAIETAGKILFIDARSKGVIVNRRQRVLTDEEIEDIADVYRRYKRLVRCPRRCRFLQDAVWTRCVRHDHKLTPGIYVGTEADDEEAESFDEVMPRMIEELRGLFAESNEFQGQILADLEGLE